MLHLSQGCIEINNASSQCSQNRMRSTSVPFEGGALAEEVRTGIVFNDRQDLIPSSSNMLNAKGLWNTALDQCIFTTTHRNDFLARHWRNWDFTLQAVRQRDRPRTPTMPPANNDHHFNVVIGMHKDKQDLTDWFWSSWLQNGWLMTPITGWPVVISKAPMRTTAHCRPSEYMVLPSDTATPELPSMYWAVESENVNIHMQVV